MRICVNSSKTQAQTEMHSPDENPHWLDRRARAQICMVYELWTEHVNDSCACILWLVTEWCGVSHSKTILTIFYIEPVSIEWTIHCKKIKNSVLDMNCYVKHLTWEQRFCIVSMFRLQNWIGDQKINLNLHSSRRLFSVIVCWLLVKRPKCFVIVQLHKLIRSMSNSDNNIE